MKHFLRDAPILALLGWFVGFSAWTLTTYTIPWPDEPHFAQPAYRLVTNGQLSCPLILGQEDHVFWVPAGYFAPLGAFLAITGFGLEQQRAFSILCGCGILLLTYVLALRITQRRIVAFLSSLFLAFDPFFLRYAKLGRMDALALLLLLSALLLFLSAMERKSFALYIASGAILGYAGFVHPIATIFLLVLVAWAGLWKRGELSKKVLVALLVPAVLPYVFWLFYGLSDVENFFPQLGFQWQQKTGRSIVHCLETLVSDYRTLPVIGVAYLFGIVYIFLHGRRYGIPVHTKLLLLSGCVLFIVAVRTTEAPHILYALPFLCVILAMACDDLVGRSGIAKYCSMLVIVLFVGNGFAHAAYFGWKYRIDRPTLTSCEQLSRMVGPTQRGGKTILLDGYPELYWEFRRRNEAIRIIEPPFFRPDLHRKALQLVDLIVLVRGFHVASDSLDMAQKVNAYEQVARSVDKELQYVAAVGMEEDWMFSARIYRVIPIKAKQ